MPRPLASQPDGASEPEGETRPSARGLRREHEDVRRGREPARFELTRQLRDHVEAARLGGLRQRVSEGGFDRVRWANSWPNHVRVDHVSRVYGRLPGALGGGSMRLHVDVDASEVFKSRLAHFDFA